MRLHELQQKNSRARGATTMAVASARLPEPNSTGVPSNAAMLRHVCALPLRRHRLNVHGWLADDGAANEGEVYEAMACPASTRGCIW
jgi:hypothetical protein